MYISLNEEPKFWGIKASNIIWNGRRRNNLTHKILWRSSLKMKSKRKWKQCWNKEITNTTNFSKKIRLYRNLFFKRICKLRIWRSNRKCFWKIFQNYRILRIYFLKRTQLRTKRDKSCYRNSMKIFVIASPMKQSNRYNNMWTPW